MLKKIIYASRAVHPLSDTQLMDLLDQSRQRNNAAHVTGLLLYAGQSFLQVLEGEAADVDTIDAAISKDERHTDLRLLMDHESPHRQFENWAMGFDHLDDNDLHQSLEGYKAAIRYPLVSPKLVRNGTVAETLLGLYNRN